MRKAVFLDRDGVLNKPIVIDGRPFPPSASHKLELIPGVSQALQSLHNAGYLLIVVTNQPDVARGTLSRETVEAINSHLLASLPIDEIRTCYHDDHHACQCRKPQPGALYSAATLHNIDLRHSYMVGDRWRDVAAGTQAGCTTFFIDYEYSEKQPTHYDYKVSNLLEAADLILQSDKSHAK